MVYQISFNNRFTIRIFKDRRPKNLCSLQGRCRRQSNTNRIKILHNTAVLTLIIQLIPVQDLIVTHFLIKDIATVGFINDNKIVIRYCRHGLFIVIQDTLNHALDGCHLNTGFPINSLIIQPLNIVNIIQGHQVFQLHFFKDIRGLLTQGITVHKEKDSSEAPCFQKAVDHSQYGSGLSRTCGHGQENILLTINDRLLGCPDCLQLIFTEIQPVFITQKIIRHIDQLLIPCGNILLQKFHDTGWADPAM